MIKTRLIYLYLLLLPSPLLYSGLTACSSDDEDAWRQETPAEKAYPLQITGASITSMSRSSATEPWMDGSEIGVRMGADGNIGKYRLNADGSIKETVTAAYGPQSNASVTAWYPYGEISGQYIGNQSSGISNYDFLKAEADNISFGNAGSLTFNHIMSKVRVTLQQPADPPIALDLTKATVRFLGDIYCTYKEGSLTSGSEGYITAFNNQDGSYGALLVPREIKGSDRFIQIEVGGNILYSPLVSDITLLGGNVYSYTATLNMTVDLTANKNEHINIDDCILDGKNTEIQDKKIIINDGATVILKDINLTGKTYICCKGNARVILKGTNVINSTSALGIYTEGNSSQTLTIDGTDNDQLTVTTNGLSGPICAINKGNITINGGHIIATNNGEGAAIGCRKQLSESYCNKITINGGIIEAQGGSFAAGIGSSNHSTCGDILITGGTITTQGGSGGAGIGAGQTRLGKCGAITITGGTIKTTSIGHGFEASSGDIIISGGTITVPNRASIDTGSSSASVTITEGATMNYTAP